MDNTQAIVRDNVIDGNPRQGVLIGGIAVASLSGNTITNNGLSPGTEPAGGVVVWENGQADLGGGALTIVGQTLTSRGNNRIQGNGVADVRNLRTGYTVKAEANCWDHQVLSTILSTDRAGDVDVDPFAAACGATSSHATAAADPTYAFSGSRSRRRTHTGCCRVLLPDISVRRLQSFLESDCTRVRRQSLADCDRPFSSGPECGNPSSASSCQLPAGARVGDVGLDA